MKRILGSILVLGLVAATPAKADYSYVHVESSDNGYSRVEVRQEVHSSSQNMNETDKKAILKTIYEKQIAVYNKLIRQWQKLGWNTDRFEKEIKSLNERINNI